MGRFWSAMKSVWQAITSAPRWVWERCERTGMMVLRTFLAPVEVLFDGTAPRHMQIPMDIGEGLQQILSPNRQTESETIRRVAAQFLIDEIQEKDVNALPQRVARWLSLMENRELAKIMASDHHQIEAHVYGQEEILDVLGFSKKAMDQRIADIEDAERRDQEAAAEHKRRMNEIDRQARSLEYAQRRRREAEDKAKIVSGLTPSYGV